jgi:hypothetical protein
MTREKKIADCASNVIENLIFIKEMWHVNVTPSVKRLPIQQHDMSITGTTDIGTGKAGHTLHA